MAERIANKGYFALKVQATKPAAVTPNDYIPLYRENLTTNINLDEDNPIVGHKFLRHQVLQGQRSHKGEISVYAEPNTAAKLFDMVLTKGAPSGGGPYTHPFTLSATTDPNAYTVDIAKGAMVFRYIGVEASEISPTFEENKMVLNLKVSALKSFSVRELSGTPTGTNPYTIVLKTDYDPSPTDGLVVGDIMTLFKADGSTVNFAVASIVDATSITTTTDVTSGAAADFITLRPASPSFTMKSPFLWSATEFRYGATAAAALSAAQTRHEKGSMWKILHPFESEDGAMRSGALDPAALVRLQGDAEFNSKLFFDTVDDLNRFNARTKRAVVIRHFSEGSTYELRITINNMKARAGGHPPVESGGIIYQELDWAPTYDSSDAQGVDVKVINNLATI